jgi:ketosteroid isomerase-like protein
VRKDIEAITEKSEKDLMAGIIDTTLAQYTDDAVSLPNHQPMMKGKQSIRQNMLQMMGMGMKFPMVEFTTTDVQVSGNFAFEIGTYKMTIEMPGMGSMTDEGKYLTIYERAADGSWKIKVETWNTDKQPPMPPPAS